MTHRETVEELRGGPAADRRDESRHKRAEVLRVARHQFITKGYRRTKMGDIALATGVSKRTLYMWHDDKAALFRACVIQGAKLFPFPEVEEGDDLPDTLRRFALELSTRLSQPVHSGMGRLLLREEQEFPELLPEALRTYEAYLIEPVAAWLRQHGLEEPDQIGRARMFVTMALAPVHDMLLLGAATPDADAAGRHADLTTRIFLHGVASTLASVPPPGPR